MTAGFLIVIALLIAVGYATGNTVVAAAGTPSPGPSPLPTPTPKTSKATSNTTVTSGGYKSDGSITGSAITNNASTWPGSDNYWNICAAVALAEGYNQGQGVAPYDLNNPGDLSPGDENGQATCGSAQYHGGSNVIFFCTAEGGWAALRQKFINIVTGASSVYGSDDSWSTVASKYAGNSSAWLNNVTSYLGVDPSSTPADYVNGANAV